MPPMDIESHTRFDSGASAAMRRRISSQSAGLASVFAITKSPRASIPPRREKSEQAESQREQVSFRVADSSRIWLRYRADLSSNAKAYNSFRNFCGATCE